MNVTSPDVAIAHPIMPPTKVTIVAHEHGNPKTRDAWAYAYFLQLIVRFTRLINCSNALLTVRYILAFHLL